VVTCGAFTPAGEFVKLPELDLERLETAWQDAVFALYLAEDKIEPEVVENMRSWQHSGFSIDQSVLLPAGDQAGIERLVQYMTRCPFSLSRLVKISQSGQVVYKAEKQACRAFPDLNGDGMQSGPKRNYQILSPLDFLAEFTQHIQVYGDVAGVLMEKPGLSRSDRTLLDGIHASWTGVREEHLRQCAAKADAGKAVGVVVYAVHKSRAQPILEAVRRGLVTHLVTEMGLAAEMKRLAEQAM
jgi:hypothetical protein